MWGTMTLLAMTDARSTESRREEAPDEVKMGMRMTGADGEKKKSR